MIEKITEFLKNNIKTVEITLMIVFIAAIIVLFVLAWFVEKKAKDNRSKVKKMVTISILAALSVILYYFIKFPLTIIIPIIPPFLKVHFSNVPVYIGGFLFGPISGSIIVFIRFVAKLPGSSSLGVGELSDLIIGLATVLVSSLIYYKKKTKKRALLSSGLIVVVWIVSAVITNWLFILPIYINLYGFNAVFGMLSSIPGITAENTMLYYILFGVIPFNLILALVVSFITFIFYKQLSNIYKTI